MSSSYTSTSTTVNETHSKIVTTSSVNSETNETISKTIITENGTPNEFLNMRNSKNSSLGDFAYNEKRKDNGDNIMSSSTPAVTTGSVGFKRIAGKEISTMFEV